MDPAEQLARLYQAGFEIQKLERFPRGVCVLRGECVAVLEPRPEGLALIGSAGWRIGEGIGVLVEKDGRQVFQSKDQIIEATAERLRALRQFEADLRRLFSPESTQ